MKTRKYSLSAAVATVVALLVAPAIAIAAGLPLKIAVIARPQPTIVFEGDGKPHVAYELYVANFTNSVVRIDSLTASWKAIPDASIPAASVKFSGDQLKAMFSSIGGNAMKPQDPVLNPSVTGVLYVFLNQNPGTPITNRLEVEVNGKPDTRQTVMPPTPINVSHQQPIVIAPPLSGDNWWTPNGPSNNSIHRRIIIAMGPKIILPERYAVDWVKLGPDGNTFHGDKSINKSYYAYGASIHAVADGTIVSTLDGIPENTPQSPKMAVTITLGNIVGNAIVEDVGDGRYAMYAHLIPGSLRVRKGERVTRGQVLGLLGNSGNSSEPHLHFQISNSAGYLDGEGLPFLLDHFTRRDYHMVMKGETPVSMTLGASHNLTDQIFMSDDLGNFPGK